MSSEYGKGTQWGWQEPQKIPPFRIVEFWGGPRHDDPPKATASI
uniref:Uncharacterized protein n=1 Tax=Klebsiella pneumoniae TaxID=573 RepID=A0A2P1BNA7_KLEPN|nr:hypothetical protein [Klebsiella pneumoniae]